MASDIPVTRSGYDSRVMCEVIEGSGADVQRRIQKLLDDGCLVKSISMAAVQYEAYDPRVFATVMYIAWPKEKAKG